MSMHFADIARHAAEDGSLSHEEILALRRAGWADGQMSREEAEAVFAAQRASSNPSPEWSDFFVEAIKQHMLERSEPKGYASDEGAQWLIAQVRADGRICTMTELEMLTRILEKAYNVPQRLKSFVLEVLEESVMTGTGPTRDGGALSDTHVSDAECRLIRRVIFSASGDRPAAVGREEAEMLFRIKDASVRAANSPEFKRLFVQGVANYLMGFSGSAGQISRERQIELNAFVADNEASVGGFMGRMANTAPNAFGMVFGKRSSEAKREDQVAEAAEVTAGEHDWLESHIAANGEIDEYDQALIEFMAEESGLA